MGKNTSPPTVAFDPQTHQTGHYDPMEDDDVTNEVLDQILAQLGEPCRTILLMKAQGYKNREIAKTLGMAEQTIKNKKGRCEDKLKNLTKDL
jgi:RNA polymerase sigma factor (sigma-70 family)